MIDESFYTEVKTTLTRFFQNIPLTPILPEIEQIINFGIQEQFETEGKYFGSGWEPLKESTIKRRQSKKKWPGKILQVTGGLASSVTSDSQNASLVIGLSKSYAVHLHYGTKNDKMKARPILPTFLPQEMLDQIADVVANHIFKISR